MTRKYTEIVTLSNNFKKLVLLSNVSVTKELAAELLLLNTENRPVREAKLKQYKEDLLAGEWKFAADVIKISKLGVLLDGQHRLLAIVQTGVPMVLHIQTGLEPEVFTVLDTGAQRNSSDVIALSGYKYASVLPGVSKLINAFYNKTSVSTARSGGRTNRAILNIVETFNKELLEEACHQGSIARTKAKFLDSILCGAFWYISAIKGLDKEATQFLYLLATGDGLGAASNSSVFLLRNRLISNISSPSKLTKDATFYLIGTCFNYYLKGKALQKLPVIKEELPDL